MSPYLTTQEAAELLRLSPDTLSNKKARGLFVEGRHYFKRRGMAARWDRAALMAWLEGKDSEEQAEDVLCGECV